MRFHVLGIPHTVSTSEYSSCAFTQKVVKLCKMLKMEGHHVIHYGHELSVVECDEHVPITTDQDLETSYPGHDWKKAGWPIFSAAEDHVFKVFHRRAIKAIKERQQPADFLLLSFGSGHKPVADGLSDLNVCESGIGYPDGGYAPYRVFESYAAMHAYWGIDAIKFIRNDFWYSAVIPNAFDLNDFTFSTKKDDYFLFIGRVYGGKGIHIAEQLSTQTGTRLVVAGAGDFAFEPGSNVERVGLVNPAQRAELLSKAKAVICASSFLEPFCGVQIEAMLSGTPVISSDWGAFAEYNIHGSTGYRCRTFEHFLWAARNIGTISPHKCRDWALRFSLQHVAPMYTEFFTSVQDVHNGPGWYEQRPARTSLDNLVI